MGDTAADSTGRADVGVREVGKLKFSMVGREEPLFSKRGSADRCEGRPSGIALTHLFDIEGSTPA